MLINNRLSCKSNIPISFN